MVEVKLVDAFVESTWRSAKDRILGIKDGRWYATVALNLSDSQARKALAEWFYLVACSEPYMRNPVKKGPELNKRYVIVQNTLDLDELRNIAAERLHKVEAADWDEFYEQMQKYFLYEK